MITPYHHDTLCRKSYVPRDSDENGGHLYKYLVQNNIWHPRDRT